MRNKTNWHLLQKHIIVFWGWSLIFAAKVKVFQIIMVCTNINTSIIQSRKKESYLIDFCCFLFWWRQVVLSLKRKLQSKIKQKKKKQKNLLSSYFFINLSSHDPSPLSLASPDSPVVSAQTTAICLQLALGGNFQSEVRSHQFSLSSRRLKKQRRVVKRSLRQEVMRTRAHTDRLKHCCCLCAR